MTTEAPALTAKQQQVLDLIGKDKSIPEIAKKLKITNSGVYGHLRNMRRAGVTIPGDTPTEDDTPEVPEPTLKPVATNGNGHALGTDHAANVVREAVTACDRAISEYEAEAQQIQARVEELRQERENAITQKERYTNALAALTS